MSVSKITVDVARGLLTGKTFLGSLPEAAMDQLMRSGHIRRFAKGAQMFQRGDAGDSLFVILSGCVKISNITPEAREVVLNFLTAGDINGEIAALDGGARTATATATEDTDVFQLYRRDLIPVLTRHPEALLEVVELLCEKLRATSEIVEDGLRDMRGRFASGLLRLARLHGKKTPRGITLDLGVNQRDLGGYLGLSRENTSRQIASLAAEGILANDNGTLVILDEEALTALSEGG